MPRDWRLQLDDIDEAIRRIQSYTADLDFERFGKDVRTQDAVIRNLEIIGEASRSLPNEVQDQCPDIEWRKIIALRNILIHAYFGVNLSILWDIISTKLGPLSDAIQHLRDE
jgi:uncharacterized protein with HEPN domain